MQERRKPVGLVPVFPENCGHPIQLAKCSSDKKGMKTLSQRAESSLTDKSYGKQRTWEMETFKAKMLWCLICSGKSCDNKGKRPWITFNWDSIGSLYTQNNIILWNVIPLLLLIWYLCQHKLVIPKSTENGNIKTLLTCLLLFSMS